MSDTGDGAILWYRRASGHGLVRADDGRRFFFQDSANKLGYEVGLRVCFEPPAGDGAGQELGALTLPGGRRIVQSQVEPSKAKPKPARRPGAAAAPAAPKKRRRRKNEEPQARFKGRWAPGRSVFHPTFGAGHVVSSTENMASIQFLNGQRRTVSYDDFAKSDGQQVVGRQRPRRREERDFTAPTPMPKKPGSR